MPGDDIRSIYWNVTARYGKPFVKKFTEERELTVMLLVDASASHQFGTQNKFKSELIAELASVLAFSAIKNNDRVGMIIFTDKIEKTIRPKKGRNHILRLIREILFFKPEGKGTSISQALGYLNELWRRKAVVFVLSDFMDKDYERALRLTNKRHYLIAIDVSDPRETALPKIGLLEVEDAETCKRITIDTSNEFFLKEFKEKKEKWLKNTDSIFKRSNVDHVHVSTDKPYILPLIQFFKKRQKRFGR